MPTPKKPAHFDQLIGMIRDLDSTDYQNLITDLTEKNPSLAQALLEAMFTFKDLIYVTDRSMQELIKEIDRKVLVKALKKTTEEMTHKILSNLSKRAGEALLEEINLLPPLRLSEVQDAQRHIAKRARSLEEQGRIVVVRPEDDDPLV